MNIIKIESAIAELPLQDLSEFAEWFEEFYAKKIDQKLEKAVEAGKFDALAAKAKEDFTNGNSSDL